MTDVVLDASALLALINRERGAEQVAAVVAGAVMSSVNLAEVLSKLIERGMSTADASLAVDILAVDIVDFTRSLAEAAGAMVVAARRQGLSLGDRACLALAAERGLPALTADRSWSDMDGVEITLIR